MYPRRTDRSGTDTAAGRTPRPRPPQSNRKAVAPVPCWCVSWKAARVADFTGENLTGSRFEDVYLRRYPDRVKMRPTDAEGFREAWDILERLWQRTVERSRGMAPELLHERVEGEWSFIETLRHLVFATDAWVKRAILGEPSPWSPLDLPHDEMPDEPGVPRDRGARPSLDEVLALRADRMATVRRVIADLTDEKLAGMTEPVVEPGYPEPESFAVRRCLLAILNEEWEHRLYAERDFDVLGSRPS